MLLVKRRVELPKAVFEVVLLLRRRVEFRKVGFEVLLLPRQRVKLLRAVAVLEVVLPLRCVEVRRAVLEVVLRRVNSCRSCSSLFSV